MFGNLSPFWEKIAFSFTLILSLVMLFDLSFVVPYQCGQVSIRNGGEYSCEIEFGWYIFTVAFIFLAIYSGYKQYLQCFGNSAPNIG